MDNKEDWTMQELRTWLERGGVSDPRQEISDKACAVTDILRTKGCDNIPWLSKCAVVVWNGTYYSQTKSVGKVQTAFFVPHFFKYDDGSASPQGYCMVVLDPAPLLYQPAEELAQLINAAISSGNCWVPGF